MKGGERLLPPSTVGDVPADIACTLVYLDRMPKINGHQVSRYARSRLSKRARRIFGSDDIPWFMQPQVKASVRIVRVLGPRQKPMDDDSLALLTGGIRDALKPGYIKDDSPKWATFTYVNDGTRRAIGPRIEVEIVYA
jgi:hypothetical protein